MGGKGSGGKNRKRTAVKKAEGNRGKRKLNKAEPPSLPGEPLMPGWLKGESRKVWPEVCSALQEIGVLFKTDGLAIAALCNSLALFIQSNAHIAKFGIVLADVDQESGMGVIRTNPAVRVRSDALRHLRSSWQAFGLDPASRSAIRMQDPDDKPTETALESILRAKGASDDVVM